MQITLKAARVSAGFTQQGLAEEMGVNRMTLANWENGKTRISTPSLMCFASLTGFSIDDIKLPTVDKNN